MTPLGIFGRKKKAEKPTEVTKGQKQEKTQESLLEKLCKGDNELCNALSRTLLLDVESTKSQGDIDKRVANAQGYEKDKENVRARVEYQAAGELALYEGNATLAQKFFKKAAEVDPTYVHKNIFEYFAKKENAEKAVAIASEYYAQTAKTPHTQALS